MKNKLIIFAVILLFINIIAQEQSNMAMNLLNPQIQKSVKNITFDELGGESGKVKIDSIDRNTVHIEISFVLHRQTMQDDWNLKIEPNFKPSFNWAPHITPTQNNIIAQHVFRQPAMIVSNKAQVLIVIPDVEILNEQHYVDWYMDMNAPLNILTLGMSKSKLSDHVIYERQKGGGYPKGIVKFGFYVKYYSDSESVSDPFGKVDSFFWNKWGSKLLASGDPSKGDLTDLSDRTYQWAFKNWKDVVWQQFKINGEEVGAPVFIVNVTQSPDYKGPVNEREFRSIWNQAWFSSLRAASGLYRYARRTGDDQLKKKALMTKELALSFPMKNGFFYGLIGTEMKKVHVAGEEVNRSRGWKTFFWGNSNRNPYNTDPRNAPFHIADMSWTAYQMIEWYKDLEKDQRLLNYAITYANALLKIQTEDGFYPAWLDTKTLKPLEYLSKSPETSMSVTFLFDLYQVTGNEVYKDSALKALTAVQKKIIPVGKWEDFETYWSDNKLGRTLWVGNKIYRNNMYKQNNMSIFWTAQALLSAYQVTNNLEYLKQGQKVLDELLMTQESWQPYFIPIPAVGGFGVMNADGEWNDARQSLFAELIIQYGQILGIKEYTERGIAALRASFTMMYCPENLSTKKQWEEKWPFFGPKDYGFMMENYGHDGVNNDKGLGIGEFTIYSWGNGAASEAYNRIMDHYGKNFILQNGVK